MEQEKLTANKLVDMLRQRYAGDAHVVLEQVADGTGGYLNHWVDAVVFSLWASKGLTRSAFEIKIGRSDFIHELQNPLKHKWVKECFHEFWFVTPKDVIQDELPNGVGWMYPRGGQLVIKKHCVRNDNPKLDDVLLASFMRSAWKEIMRATKRSRENVLANSEEYKQAKLFEQAVSVFCKKRDIYVFQDGQIEEILGCLEKASGNKEFQQDLSQLATITDNFQRKIVDLFSLFAVVANKAILARDETGEYLIEKWGTYETDALQLFREKDGGKGKWQSKYRNEAKEILEIIRKFGELEGKSGSRR